jgi:hypothetical protein
MRCLYCGKELALLKRWTGGGEFCSDAHRLRYQEEYNQLALNRLLQAKPPNDPAPGVAPKPVAQKPFIEPVRTEAVREPNYSGSAVTAPPVKAPALRVSESPQSKPAVREIPAPAAPSYSAPSYAVTERGPETAPQPAAIAQQPLEKKVPEVAAPAEIAGFLIELPLTAISDVAELSRPDPEFVGPIAAAELPNHQFDAAAQSSVEARELDTAGLLSFPLSNQASNYSANSARERKLDVRDFLRTAPLVEVALAQAGETGLETSSAPIDFLLTAVPAGEPTLWLEAAVDFAPGATELGDLARLAFAAESDGEATAAAVEPARVEQASAEPPTPKRNFLEIFGVRPAPVVVFDEPQLQPVVEAAPEPPPQQIEEKPADPQAVTVPQTVVAHPAVPSKGKTVQVFSSAAYAAHAQVPRSTSLPLRPLMMFGPAPAPKPEAKPVELKKAALPPAPAPIAGPSSVFRRPAFETPKSGKQDKKDDKKPDFVKSTRPLAKLDAKAELKPEVIKDKPEPEKPVKDKKPEARDMKLRDAEKPVKMFDAPLPAPLAPPYPGTNSDLGLPRLSLQPQPGLLGRLPLGVRIAVAVAMLAVVGGVIAMSSKSGTATVTPPREPMVVPGTALPVSDSGWIADWGADPGVRKTRTISVLRSSQTYTDYRIEMEGQIESKAIGWVFRAADPKNFYVTKLEIVKPGLEPTIALVRFAVINGEEQARVQLPLQLKVRRDTMFKIRFDAVGGKFTTYVQDEKIDEWTDDRVKSGGVGMYSERGEVATLKGGVQVVPLVVRR